MTPFIEILIDRVKHEYSLPPPRYSDCEITPQMMSAIQRECTTQNEIDTANMRYYIYNHAFVQGKAPVLCRRSAHGTLIVALESAEQQDEVPWETWFRILRLFHKTKHITALVLARMLERIAPSIHHPIKPVHINGGSTYSCSPETICVYRAEDATRVLIHELFHAMCSDDHREGVDWVEAKTEAWAEVIHAIILAKGKRTSAVNGIKKQLQWMEIQNHGIRSGHMQTTAPSEFPWRYTIGKEIVFRRITGLHTEPSRVAKWSRSLRLTPPPTAEQKRAHGVATSSTML
jgi:hypothetical protein